MTVRQRVQAKLSQLRSQRERRAAISRMCPCVEPLVGPWYEIGDSKIALFHPLHGFVCKKRCPICSGSGQQPISEKPASDQVRAIRHRIAHRLGWTTGKVETFWANGTGYLMVGFRCDVCGQLEGVHRVTDSIASHFVKGH